MAVTIEEVEAPDSYISVYFLQILTLDLSGELVQSTFEIFLALFLPILGIFEPDPVNKTPSWIQVFTLYQDFRPTFFGLRLQFQQRCIPNQFLDVSLHISLLLPLRLLYHPEILLRRQYIALILLQSLLLLERRLRTPR